MKQSIFEITANARIAQGVFRMELAGDASAITSPGQFVNIRIEGKYLRRPVSVCDCRDNQLVLVYKVVGSGTRILAEKKPGEVLDLLTGLGNGYDLTKSGARPLLVGGGVGVPPLYWLCRKLLGQGKEVTVIMGFNTYDEVFYEQEFRDLGAHVLVTTADGSYGEKGFVTDGMRKLQEASENADPFYTFFYTCGPGPMFRAIESMVKTDGQYSFEERMGCGFGACMGCSLTTRSGSKRVCKDGPVFDRSEILWETKA